MSLGYLVRGEFEFLVPSAASHQDAMDVARSAVEAAGGRMLRRDELWPTTTCT